MKTLQRVKERRRMMLVGLARQDMLKGDFKRMLGAMGYDGSKRQFDPTRFRPPTDNTQDFMQKWVQVALNVLLGTKLKIDGKLGPITRQAIKRLQRQEGITSHGYVDDRTLQVLELRVGVRAPRHVEHEAVPHLLMLPRRGVWKPKRRRDRPTRGKKQDEEGGEQQVEEALPVAEKPAKPGILQDEAMNAAAALAFDDGFVADAATELERKDKPALRKAMHAWFKEQQAAEEPTEWLQRARDLARAHVEASASILRQSWWQSEGGEVQ